MSTYLAAHTLLIEGPDAVAFAHAQFSSTVNSLKPGQWQFSAWLDPQGRVRALFHLARLGEDRLLLLLRGGEAAPLAEGLQRFVFRSKLTLSIPPVRALGTGPAMALFTANTDAHTLTLGCDSHSLLVSTAGPADDHWRLPQLRAGWPWLPAPALDDCLPPALSLQRLQAVVIDKGCYPGQEIVARLHFRSGHKRHLHRVMLSHPAAPGEPLRGDERERGRLLDVVVGEAGIEALAVLADDLVAQAVGGELPVLNGELLLTLRDSWPA